MSQLTTHILDTHRGAPADEVAVILYQFAIDTWTEMSRGITNNDGRVPDLLSHNIVLEPGTYKLRFETLPYFEKMNVSSFYPYIEICFDVTSSAHYHVPLLLNAYGYSTYRGS
jgi:5-hydroxyisourate hydrolase